MAITLPSENDILNQTLNYFRLQFPAEDLSTYSFLGLMSRVFASEASALNESILAADTESPPNARTSSVGLDNWAFIFGLPNGNGGYGRRGAVPASGGSANITGVAATTFTAGLTAIDSTGQIIVSLDSNVKLPVSGVASATFSAQVAGSASNLPTNSVLTWQSPPAGADPTFTLVNPLEGGEDLESDSELLARILFRLQNPPKGGTAADYREWAEESLDSNGVSNGIVRAYVYPLKSGTGSVDVIITQAGTGRGRIPGPGKVAQVQNYMNKKRPVTAKLYVKADLNMQMPLAKALTITFRGAPNLPKYDYDWKFPAAGTYFTVTNYNLGTKTITLPSAIASLEAALIAAAASGIFPTMAYYAAGGTAIPYILTVVSSNLAGQYTVAANIPVTPQIGIDNIGPGSVAIVPVLTAVSNYIDTLGPSRISGYADPYDTWFANVSLADVARVALDVEDTDGVKYLSDIPYIGENKLIPGNPGTGINIKVDGGLTTSLDYIPGDIGIPEIAFCGGGGLRLGQV